MRSIADHSPGDRLALGGHWPLLALAAGALILYLPVFADFARGPWRRDENAHALIVMALAVGAAASRLMSERLSLSIGAKEQFAGLAALIAGLLLVIFGAASEADLLRSASLTFVSTGIVLSLTGWRGVRNLWFALFLTLYLIIWPGWALDALTAPLKIFVSEIVSDGLYAAGLPVAQAGAVISAGAYQLLVADACSGLNSMIALTAVGAVYLYAVKHGDWRINLIVIAALIPIAIAANILRVTALVLITYYLGYDAGQGFLHDGAGLLMFAAALGLVFLIDSVALFVLSNRKGASS
jgi:exosortase